MRLFIIISLLLSITLNSNAMNGDCKNTKVQSTVYSFSGDSGAFDWISKGKIKNVVVSLDGYPSGKKSILLYFAQENINGGVITLDSIHAIAIVAQLEIQTNVIDSFIKEKLSHVLVSALGQIGSSVLSSLYLEKYISNMGDDIHPMVRGDEESLERIRELCSGVQFSVENNNWKIEFNIITSRGGIERWSASGILDKFEINSFSIESKESEGSVRPLVFF